MGLFLSDGEGVVCTVKLEREVRVDEGESVPFKIHVTILEDLTEASMRFEIVHVFLVV